ncbi:hypothetical protein ACQP0C_12985 [Nocardia sp. CA-129566]|uniref:hypothetical protein n=1 Tax=Nocardia sp. CA-129566 TaxID=3239976 RepID=UPI003D96E409
MADVLVVPPSTDFEAFNKLVSAQTDHFAAMVTWTGKECSETDGLTALLSKLQPYVPEVAQHFSGKLSQCQRGMGVITDKVSTVNTQLRTQDEQNAADLQKIYPDALPGFPDISSLPGGSLVGDFSVENEDFKLVQPPDPPDSGIISNLATITGKFNYAAAAESVYKAITGNDLRDQLLKPLLGDWDRLFYLHGAYDTLGDGCYVVAGTLRKGSWKLGSEWQGVTATAFDSYMFKWTMGIGGIGDAAKVVSKAYEDGYHAIIELAKAAIAGINALFNLAINKLIKKVGEMLAGDAAIEIVGLGPEDPLADAAAAAWTAYKGYEIYKVVREIVQGVNDIIDIFENIDDEVEKIQQTLQQVVASAASPLDVGSLIDQVEQHGFEFEKDKSWNAEAGSARIALLPSV